MQNLVLYKEPIFVDFDRRRRVVINLRAEILIRNAGGKDAPAWEEVGQRVNPVTGERECTLAVNEDNLRLYLWAALQDDAKAHGEMLTMEDLKWLSDRHNWAQQAVLAIRRALNQYYGNSSQVPPKRTKQRRAARRNPWTWEDAFRVVCGELALSPSEFYQLLYSELVLILEGYRARQKRQAIARREESAWLAAWFLAPHRNPAADPITPDMLLGRKRREKPAPRFANDEAKARALVAAFRAQSEREEE